MHIKLLILSALALAAIDSHAVAKCKPRHVAAPTKKMPQLAEPDHPLPLPKPAAPTPVVTIPDVPIIKEEKKPETPKPKKVEPKETPSKPPSSVGIYKSGLQGEITHFDDDSYACGAWKDIAKKAIKKGFFFAATNHMLYSPKKGGVFKMTCDPGKLKCARVNGKEYYLIDFCSQHNCDYSHPGHLDVLVGKESGNTCVSGCEGYNNAREAGGKWELVECSKQIYKMLSSSSFVNSYMEIINLKREILSKKGKGLTDEFKQFSASFKNPFTKNTLETTTKDEQKQVVFNEVEAEINKQRDSKFLEDLGFDLKAFENEGEHKETHKNDDGVEGTDEEKHEDACPTPTQYSILSDCATPTQSSVLLCTEIHNINPT